jgi:hypothetical protein
VGSLSVSLKLRDGYSVSEIVRQNFGFQIIYSLTVRSAARELGYEFIRGSGFCDS